MQQKSLFKNTIYKAILSLFNIVVPIIVGPYITRLLDVQLYGTYNKVFSEFQFFLTFASFGIYNFGVREISKIRDDKKKVEKLFSNLFLLSIITNLIVMIIYIAYSLFTSSGLTTALYMIMIIQIVGNIFYIEFVNEALENYKFITIKTIIVRIIYFASIFVFVRKPEDIIIYAVVICFTVFLNNIISFIYAKRKLKFDFSNIEIKKYIKSMLFILIITNADLLYTQLDRVMLGKIINDVSVTYYYIPYYIVTTVAAIPYAIINVSVPRLSYLIKNQSKEEYLRVLKKSLSSLLFVIVPMCIGMFVLSNEIINIYAGEKYLGTSMSVVLMIACLARIIISTEAVFTNLVMYPHNKEKQIAIICVSFGIVNFILNILLVLFKVFTPVSALITTAIAELGFLIVESIYAKKKLQLNINVFEGRNKSYFILSILFIPIAYLIKLLNLPFILNILVIVLTCVLFYAGILYIKKDESLIFVINKFLNKIKLGVK